MWNVIPKEPVECLKDACLVVSVNKYVLTKEDFLHWYICPIISKNPGTFTFLKSFIVL